MEKKIKTVGYLADKPNWVTNGKGCYREQDYVISVGGYAGQSRLPIIPIHLKLYYGE